MNKVYIVSHGEKNKGCETKKVYSTEKAAVNYIEKVLADLKFKYNVFDYGGLRIYEYYPSEFLQSFYAYFGVEAVDIEHE